MPRGKPIDAEWLCERYPRMTSVNTLIDDYEREFGWRPTKTSVYVKASKLGLRKEPVSGRDNRAERSIYWSKEPEMVAWMLEHDHGQRMDELQAEWREHWGFGISRGQVNIFRANHDTQTRRNHGGGRHPVPVGTERVGKDGYIVIKVREKATRPMSKDNWMLKHVWVYEQHHGPVPDGHAIYFADRNNRNFDPDNLVAVPRRLIGVLNNPSTPMWYDAESLRACIALAELKSETRSVTFSIERTCSVCGRKFVPSKRQWASPIPPKTCQECVDAGYKAHHIDHREVLRLHAMGMNYSQIARKVGCSSHYVGVIVKQAGQARRKKETG